MKRACLAGLLMWLALPGCQAPPERPALLPLPEDAPPLPYAELLTRARFQATAANEAFYVNRWADLEDMARNLEQTARFLSKSTEIPGRNKEKLPGAANELAKEAGLLRAAAKAQDPIKANEAMQRVNLRIRELRIEN
jgi:hypothetical protein